MAKIISQLQLEHFCDTTLFLFETGKDKEDADRLVATVALDAADGVAGL